MKALIFAAGKGSRMQHLSTDTPKPLLTVLDKTLLEHKLDALPADITEVLIVVGYLKEKIINHIGCSYNNKKITYIVQEQLLGTAHCLSLCKSHLLNEHKFLVMMGDDIYCKDDMIECLKYDFSILISQVESVLNKGYVIFHNDKIKEIIEQYQHDIPGYVCTGLYCLTPKIFDYTMVAINETELGLPQTILSTNEELKVIKSRFWLQITTPNDLIIAETLLRI